MNTSQIAGGEFRRCSPLRWVVTLAVLVVAAGVGFYGLNQFRQTETSGGYTVSRDDSSRIKEFSGSYTVSRDVEGRINEMHVMEVDGQLKLRATIAYDVQELRISEFNIFDKAGGLVEAFVFVGGKPSVRTQKPPRGTHAFSISARVSRTSRVWECDGSPLFGERTAGNKYQLSGPDGVILFTKHIEEP